MLWYAKLYKEIRMKYVALIGRPNVGKSTLFNRLIRANRAITHDMPGITRDRMEGIVRHAPLEPFIVIDTGGVTLDAHHNAAPGPAGIAGFEKEILFHAKTAIEEAHILCLVVDYHTGVLPMDTDIALFLRSFNKPLLLVINKVDGLEQVHHAYAEFASIGLPMIALSAEHNVNMATFFDALQPYCNTITVDDAHIFSATDAVAYTLKLALLGRPNVGKSSLVNAFCQSPRMIVQDHAGTTRDSVDVRITYKGENVILVDTAGVRRRSKITDTVEKYSTNSAIKSTTKADVSLLLVDATEGITQQDKRLLSLLFERKIPCVVLVNKIDLVPARQIASIKKDCEHLLSIASAVPILCVSAKNATGIHDIIPLAKRIQKEMHTRVPTATLNKAFETIVQHHQPPIVGNSRARFFYMTQAETNPPTFVIFANYATKVPPSYIRYIEKQLRTFFAIKYAPVRIHIRSRHDKN